MRKYKKFKDIMQDLNECGIITHDEDYHWWTGCIDGCYFADIINANERFKLLEKLEDLVI